VTTDFKMHSWCGFSLPGSVETKLGVKL